MDFKVIEQAMAFVRALAAKNKDEVPDWGKYEELVRERLKDEFNPRPRMPKEYYYAYLRVKGLSDADARERMGLGAQERTESRSGKSFWKFW